MGSRIPVLKRSASSSAPKSARSGSSILVPVQRRSAEQLGASQEKQSESSSSGVRLVEKPRGPRPKPTEQDAPLASGSAEEPEQVSDNNNPSTPSDDDAWDFKDISPPDTEERPETVFTGEHRVRRVSMPAHCSSSPTLRIAASAEDIIMGDSAGESSSPAAANPTTPSFLQRLGGKLAPSTSKDTESPKGNSSASKSAQGSKAGADVNREGTSTSPNFCRSQVSVDSLHKRDISGKELSVSRKPLGRPSLSSLFSPSLKSLRYEEEPKVPKIPDEYSTGQQSSLCQVPGGSATPATATKVTAPAKGAPAETEGQATPVPETAIRYPPRTTSLQALSKAPGGSGAEQSSSISSGLRSRVATNLRRNNTANDINPMASHIEHAGQTPGKSRLVESKSTHLLGNLRNIFRSRGAATGKDLVVSEDIEELSTLEEIEAFERENNPAKENMPRHDSETSLDAKPKYSRLSGGVNWSRSSRNPRNVPDSPVTPTPSAPRLLAPAGRVSSNNMPSFARPTQSTTTKSNASKGQTSVAPDSQTRRPPVGAASSGSPRRPARGPKFPPANLMMRPGNKKDKKDKKPLKSPVSISSPRPIPGRTALAPGQSTERTPKNLDTCKECVGFLCTKAREAPKSIERDRYVRVSFYNPNVATLHHLLTIILACPSPAAAH